MEKLDLNTSISRFHQMRESTRARISEFFERLQGEGYRVISVREDHFDLVYSDIGVCHLQLWHNSELALFDLQKFPDKFEGIRPIQKEKAFFDRYWKSNIAGYDYKFGYWRIRNNEYFSKLNELYRVLKQIKNVFLDDVIVDFRFESVSFKDYRCFHNETFKFNDRSTVLLGKNASGKTSILEALTVAIGGFLSAIDEPTDSTTISAEDIRFTSKEEEGAPITDFHPPTVVTFCTTFMDESLEWSRARNSVSSTKITTKESNVITHVVRQLVDDIRNEKNQRNIVLPVFSYHGTGRVANFTRDMGLLERMEKISRFVGYKDCLKPASNYKFFLAWYRKMKLRAFEMQKQIPSLNAVTEAILKCLQLLTDEEEDRSIETILFFEGQIHVKFSDGDVFPISYLSDGYQDVLGIVSDIAYRMAILNPKLGAEILNKTPGVVLIDEVDLHLHPKWQQKILYVLKTIFPNVQFITTTHSAIIISTTEENEALELSVREGRIVAEPVGNPRDWYIADILKQAFHVEKKPLFVAQEQAKELSLEEKLQNFSQAVKEYLPKPSEEAKQVIEALYEDLLPSVPEDSPRRRAVDSLKGLVK